MISSLIYIVIFSLTYALILFYPKSDTKLNIVKQVFLSFCIFICLIALPCFVLKIIGVTLSLNVLSIFNAIIALGLFVKIKKIGYIQRFYLDKTDLLNVLILTILFVILFVHLFSLDLRLCYLNSDIASHFNFANSLVEGNNDNVGIMYLTALINATIINIAKPVLEQVYYYKPFIIGDAFINWFGLMMFYVLLTHFVRKKSIKRFHAIFSVLFFLGFPIYSYMIGGFVYWSLGVTFICFLIYLLDVYAKNHELRKGIAILVVLSLAAIGMSYVLFVPYVFLASFICFVNIFVKEGKLFAKENVFLLLKIYIIPFLFILIGLLIWFASGQVNLGSLRVDGGIYANLYSDFLPLLPFVLFGIFCMSKTEKQSSQIFLVIIAITIAFMLVCCHMGLISRYYYYKMYYPIWTLFWVEAVIALEHLVEKKEKFALCYIAMCVVVFALQSTAIEEKIVEKNAKMQTVEADFTIFPIYRFMSPFIESGFAPHDGEEIIDAYQYVINQSQDNGEITNFIPCVTSDDYQGDCYWYSAITRNNSFNYFILIRQQGLSDDVLRKLETEVEQFFMFKDSVVYLENYDKLQKYDVEFENSVGVVYALK